MEQQKALNQQLATTSVLWNLQHLYADTEDAQLQADIAWCEHEARAINEASSGSVASLDAAGLLALVVRLEKINSRMGKLSTYAFLHFCTQIDNAAAGKLYQEIKELHSRCDRELIFFELEWNQVDENKAAALLASPQLAHYHHYLSALRRYRPHQLTEQEERLLIEKNPVGRHSWTTLFEKVLGQLRFGEEKRSEEAVLADLYSDDRDIRQGAARELTEGLQSQLHILTHIFNTLAADKMITDRLRNYPSWVASMNLDNELPDTTVNALVDAVTSRYDIVQRYYSVKKTVLGLDTICDYDRYAPLPSLPATKIGWEQCQQIVLDSFAAFSEEMATIAERFFTERWIHAPLLEGKRGGAFAHPCIPEVHPYVLVNYTGNLRDVSTVAHELGHGVHQFLAAQKGYYNCETPLVLAETASVFAELLVFQAQLALLINPEEKKAFICQKLESIFATVFRQTAMNRFENKMHQGRRDEGELSSERLTEFWLATQRDMFGESLVLTDDYGIWWSYIPHFLSTPGYVYSYAFGELLVLALYGLYQQQGDAFVANYMELLAAGGSATPAALVKPFGFDLDDPTFWHQGLKVIDTMLAQIET